MAPWGMLARCHALTFCLVVSACGGSAPKGPTAEEKQAEANKQAQDKADETAIAERKAKREADEKLKAESAAKVTAELERVVVVPEKLPKDPVEACDAVGKSHDAFVRRVGGAEAIAAWDAGGKDKAIPMTVVQCSMANSIKAAACQKNALDSAGPELKDETKKMMQLCIDKFAATKGAPPAGMPKKRPL